MAQFYSTSGFNDPVQKKKKCSQVKYKHGNMGYRAKDRKNVTEYGHQFFYAMWIYFKEYSLFISSMILISFFIQNSLIIPR